MAPMCQLTLELFLNFFVITFPIFKKEEKKKKKNIASSKKRQGPWHWTFLPTCSFVFFAILLWRLERYKNDKRFYSCVSFCSQRVVTGHHLLTQAELLTIESCRHDVMKMTSMKTSLDVSVNHSDVTAARCFTYAVKTGIARILDFVCRNLRVKTRFCFSVL